MDNIIDAIKTLVSDKNMEISQLKDIIKAKESEISNLKLHNETSQEFRKVSHVVLLEKENMRLKEEVATLTLRIEKLLSKKKQYQEKKIKGEMYFVSEDSVVYTNNNGEVGAKVGRLVKEDGRTRMVWEPASKSCTSDS